MTPVDRRVPAGSDRSAAPVSCRDDQHGGGAEADGGLHQRAQLHGVERPQLQPGSAVLAAVPHRLPRGDPGVHPGPLHPHRPQARLGQQGGGRPVPVFQVYFPAAALLNRSLNRFTCNGCRSPGRFAERPGSGEAGEGGTQTHPGGGQTEIQGPRGGETSSARRPEEPGKSRRGQNHGWLLLCAEPRVGVRTGRDTMAAMKTNRTPLQLIPELNAENHKFKHKSKVTVEPHPVSRYNPTAVD